MRIDSLSLPHPVLGVEGDVQGSFEVKADVNLGEEITLSGQIELSNPTLQSMISDGKALYCVDLDCPTTVYRKAYLFDQPDYKITIPGSTLRGKVNVNFFVIAAKDIKGYSIEEAHNSYDGFEFNVEKGDVLAYGGEASFIAKKSWEELKSVASFMQVCSMEEKKEPMYVDLQSDKITIFLSEKDFDLYDYNHNADEKFAAIFHSCMVLPALTYAVERMIEDPESYEDKKWYQILQFRKENEDALSKVAWQKNNAMRVAQAILDRPLTRTLESVKSIIDHLNSGEEI